jgi:hypothetical protein
MNVVGNYYRPGPCTKDLSAQPLRMKDHDSSKAKGFASSNFIAGMTEKFNRDNLTAVNYTNTGNYMSTSRGRWEPKEESLP